MTDAPDRGAEAPLRLVIEFDRQQDYDDFLHEHDPRVGSSCSDVIGNYRVITADDVSPPQREEGPDRSTP